MTSKLLYLTADGLLQPLGFSQVVRVVEGLSRRGWPYALFSLERAADLAAENKVRDLKARLSAAGVAWRFAPYGEGGGGRVAAQNEALLVDAAVSHRGSGIHARAYHSAVAALAAWVSRRTPYLFDARSYWFDERLEDGRWFTSPIRLAVARGVEHQLFAQAAGVVSLTELQADDVRSGRFGPSRQKAVQCITTCADFDDFTRKPAVECRRVPAEVREVLAGKRVLGIIGSVNRSYLVDETLSLVAEVLRRDANAHLLILSAQRDEYVRRLAVLGIDDARVTLTRADHEAMPEWLSLIDWGMLLLNPDSPAKRASMPTKLAEFLACGVRPVQFGCNVEVSEWVRKTGSGFVLPDVHQQTLASAAERIASSSAELELTTRARELAAPHFSLEAGLTRYEQVLFASFGELRGHTGARTFRNQR
jgi:glycosyltransferase involved in cell wall biosynthesis